MYKTAIDLENKNGINYLSMLHTNKNITSGTIWKWFQIAAKEYYEYSVAHFEVGSYYHMRTTDIFSRQ